MKKGIFAAILAACVLSLCACQQVDQAQRQRDEAIATRDYVREAARLANSKLPEQYAPPGTRVTGASAEGLALIFELALDADSARSPSGVSLNLQLRQPLLNNVCSTMRTKAVLSRRGASIRYRVNDSSGAFVTMVDVQAPDCARAQRE